MNDIIIIGFDIDMTLIDAKDNIIQDNLNLLKLFYAKGCKIWVASGGGVGYTKTICSRLKIDNIVECFAKTALPCQPDIWFDDIEGCRIGKINIQV